MADEKLTELPVTTAPADDDLVYIVTDPAGTPESKAVAVLDLVPASLPLPSGTPDAGKVPIATGAGQASAWGDLPGGGVPCAKANYGGGDITYTDTTFTDLLTTADLTIAAVAGDLLEIGLALVTRNNGAFSFNYFDAQTRVSGSGVNHISGGLSQGVPAWQLRTGATANEPGTVSGSWIYSVVSGDLSGGNVTLRLRRKLSGGTAIVFADGSNTGLQWFVKNLG